MTCPFKFLQQQSLTHQFQNPHLGSEPFRVGHALVLQTAALLHNPIVLDFILLYSFLRESTLKLQYIPFHMTMLECWHDGLFMSC